MGARNVFDYVVWASGAWVSKERPQQRRLCFGPCHDGPRIKVKAVFLGGSVKRKYPTMWGESTGSRSYSEWGGSLTESEEDRGTPRDALSILSKIIMEGILKPIYHHFSLPHEC
ncbi:hypothetical protein L1987_05512 [Smallanthus sonchifolius]|uniref:Uncharacterized protein n=1 Tax=Smallanthus sonchifolius TaxID=185202 RepID=A0ACB9JVT3_9ASTR|nr:hypothetical protein L1987_05512 [Smallanthus sonchifolius]